MRFPSLFRTPKYQQFEIKPRYYDPVKEFIEERRMVVNANQNGDPPNEPHISRIRFERKKNNEGVSATLLQLIIVLILGGLLLGWLYIGNDVLYYGLIVIPVYFFFRFKKR